MNLKLSLLLKLLIIVATLINGLVPKTAVSSAIINMVRSNHRSRQNLVLVIALKQNLELDALTMTSLTHHLSNSGECLR